MRKEVRIKIVRWIKHDLRDNHPYLSLPFGLYRGQKLGCLIFANAHTKATNQSDRNEGLLNWLRNKKSEHTKRRSAYKVFKLNDSYLLEELRAIMHSTELAIALDYKDENQLCALFKWVKSDGCIQKLTDKMNCDKTLSVCALNVLQQKLMFITQRQVNCDESNRNTLNESASNVTQDPQNERKEAVRQLLNFIFYTNSELKEIFIKYLNS